MTNRLVFIHTVPPLIEVFTRLAAIELPGVALLHVLDEPLLEHVRQAGRIDDEDVARLAGHIGAAALVGADAVLVTCSTISPAVDKARTHVDLPVLKIDEAMVAEAVRVAGQARGRIGVIATNRTTLAPTRGLIEAQAVREGVAVIVESVMVDGALDSLLHGDPAQHDRLVAVAVRSMIPTVDVVVLAQASMARVLDGLDVDGLPAPVLSSPHLALRQVAALLRERSAIREPQ